MKLDQAKSIADSALKQLTEALEHGQSETLTAYLAAMARFHNYSFGNVMLIASQNPDATHVAGFRTWKKLGRWVRKGEKGIAIIAPMIGKKSDENADDDTICRFRAVHVFDVSQTDGEDLPQLLRVQGDPSDYTDRLKTAVEQLGISLQYKDDLGGADGSSSGGTISLMEGLPAAEEFSILVHEFAHEMLHHGNGDRPESKTVRETEAEAVAFVVTQAIGLDTGTAAVDYIQLYNGDHNVLAMSLDRIQNTAAEIISVLQPDES